MKQHLIGRQCGDVIPMSSLNPGDGWIVVPGMKTPKKTLLAFLHISSLHQEVGQAVACCSML